MPRRNPRLLLIAAVASLVLSMLPAAAAAAPSSSGCTNRTLNTPQKLLDCVSADDAFVHLQAFQEIADENGGTRASGTPGYDASADYVAGLLEEAGYTVERQEFIFDQFILESSSLTADGEPVEYAVAEYSGSGTVTGGTIVPVDLSIDDPAASTSGCESEDFDEGALTGEADVVLVQRGACSFQIKAENAEAAGAEGVIIFNQGNGEDRSGLLNATLSAEALVNIPVAGVSTATGIALLDAMSVDLSVVAEAVTTTTENVIADLQGQSDTVVMAGAHLDSVLEGPGINDNGSGSAAILSVALEMANNRKYVPQNTIRFAWWGAEESGLIGAYEYFENPDFGLLNIVEGEGDDATYPEIERIDSYLNFDMVGSPNFIYGVYDADESTFEAPVPVPDGSAELEDLFEAYYSENDIPYEDTEFSGRSDYQPFIQLGVPASGLFTGAEVVKTEEQAAIWGGVAGDQFDPCYHIVCDTIDNVSIEAMDVNVDAIAYAMYNVASPSYSGPQAADVQLDGPQGTYLEGGGGLSAGHAHPTE